MSGCDFCDGSRAGYKKHLRTEGTANPVPVCAAAQSANTRYQQQYRRDAAVRRREAENRKARRERALAGV